MDEGKLLRLEEVATRASLSLGFIRREIARGELEVVRLAPRMVRISEAALVDYLPKRTERSGAA